MHGLYVQLNYSGVLKTFTSFFIPVLHFDELSNECLLDDIQHEWGKQK